MFRMKSKSEKLAEQESAQTLSKAAYLAAVRERVSPAAEVAKHRAATAASSAKDWAQPRIDHGIEVAAPKLQGAVEGLAPKVDTARDALVDSVLPKIADAIAALTAAKLSATETADRAPDALAVLKGDRVAKRRKGKFFMLLGALAAAAAAFAAFRKSTPREDPWATPLDDPYTAPTTGRDSTVSSFGSAAKDKAGTAADSLQDKASETADDLGSTGKHAARDAAATTEDAASEVADTAGDAKDKLD